MSHEVFLCYCEEDKEIASQLCHGLEENRIRCWFKSRDFRQSSDVEIISKAIKNSESVVLIYSENAKNTNSVVTEIDIAFSSDIPIFVFKIDDSSKKSDLDFFLMNKVWMDNYKDLSKNFKNLVKEISAIIDEPARKIKVPKEFKSRKSSFTAIGIAAIAVIIVVVLLISAVSVFYHTNDSGEFSIKVNDILIYGDDPSPDEKNYMYDIYFEMTNAPQNSNSYSMNIVLYNSSGDVVDNQTSNLGITFSGELYKNDVERVVVNVYDSSGKIVTNTTYHLNEHNV